MHSAAQQLIFSASCAFIEVNFNVSICHWIFSDIKEAIQQPLNPIYCRKEDKIHVMFNVSVLSGAHKPVDSWSTKNIDCL